MDEPATKIEGSVGFGLLFMAVGLVITSVAYWVNPGTLEVPRWVVGGLGVFFFLAGVLATGWWSGESLVGHVIGSVMCTAMAVVSGGFVWYGTGTLRIGFIQISGPAAIAVGSVFPLGFLGLALFGWWRTLTYNRRR